MEISEEKVQNRTKYNYWIYILTCLFVTGVPAYEMSRDSMSGERDIYSIIFQLILTFVFSSVAWIVGKKYHLNYVWVCTLGVAGDISIKVLMGILELLVFGNLYFLGFLISAFITGILIFSIAILLISYPIQLLFRLLFYK